MPGPGAKTKPPRETCVSRGGRIQSSSPGALAMDGKGAPGHRRGPYFTSQMSLVSSSSMKLWYFFLALTSSICRFTASS